MKLPRSLALQEYPRIKPIRHIPVGAAFIAASSDLANVEAYDPATDERGWSYAHGLAAATAFFDQIGFGDRWVFVQTQSGAEHGPGAGRASELLREAALNSHLIETNVPGTPVRFQITAVWKKS